MESSEDNGALENHFCMTIVERLEQMEKRISQMSAENHQHNGQPVQMKKKGSQREEHTFTEPGSWFEQRIVAVCERMMAQRQWPSDGQRLLHSVRHRGMTLLHLAAAQGYTKLIHTLQHWRNVNSQNLDLEQEVDPLNVDDFSCTPLMWACALGHQGAAELLYDWNSTALDIADSLGRLPLAVAHARGHTHLAWHLEVLHGERKLPEGKEERGGMNWVQQFPMSPISTSTDTGLNSFSESISFNDQTSSPSSAYSSSSALPGTPSNSSPNPLSSISLSPERASKQPEILMTYDQNLEVDLLSYSENTENKDYMPAEEDVEADVLILVEQIIDAMPERIKQKEVLRGAESLLKDRKDNSPIWDSMPWLAPYLDTVDCIPAHRWTNQSLQPPLPLHSVVLQQLPSPISATWAEFLNNSNNSRREGNVAPLTLSDAEQRELYEAARIIQSVYCRYKVQGRGCYGSCCLQPLQGNRLKEQQKIATAVIQRCYRKYQQYALYKKMTQAAILIQSKFRSYYEQKKFQQSRRAAVLIQQSYRSYKQYERLKQSQRGAKTYGTRKKENFLTKKQDQAARMIMRFLRRCRHRIRELKQNKELERMKKRGSRAVCE